MDRNKIINNNVTKKQIDAEAKRIWELNVDSPNELINQVSEDRIREAVVVMRKRGIMTKPCTVVKAIEMVEDGVYRVNVKGLKEKNGGIKVKQKPFIPFLSPGIRRVGRKSNNEIAKGIIAALKK